METQAGHDAELAVREAEERLQGNFNQGEHGAENGDNGNGKHGLVRLGSDGAGNAHDGSGAADAAAAGREQGEGMLDLEETCHEEIERNHDGDDDNGSFETF